jgi:transposase
MLDQTTRSAILRLREQGHGTRSIARALGISRGAVRGVLKEKSAEVPYIERAEKAEPFRELIPDLYGKCNGNLVRVHEKLLDAGASLSYQALTGFCRRHGLGHEPKLPAGHYHFEPGQEMQHDTSPHLARFGGTLRRVQTASLVLCYSRMRFIQLYPAFNRFTCKLFLTDALKYLGGSCRTCMIDNTHVVVLTGTGRQMVPVPEMAAFGERYGFAFAAHEKGDANRSAHVERGFDHVENNFLAGREFDDFAHANREAIAWCDRVNAAFRRQIHASARELFAKEKAALVPLPIWVPEVYMLHHRVVDLEGYVHVDGSVYSVPYQLIGRQVEVRETRDKVQVFQGPRIVAEHDRALGEKRRMTRPEHRPPRGTVKVVESQPSPDERELSKAEPPLPEYAQEVKKRGSNRWPLALRRLAQMRRDYPRKPFLDAVTTAAHYGLFDLDRLERMVLRNIASAYFVTPVDRLDDEEGPDEG